MANAKTKSVCVNYNLTLLAVAFIQSKQKVKVRFDLENGQCKKAFFLYVEMAVFYLV